MRNGIAMKVFCNQIEISCMSIILYIPKYTRRFWMSGFILCKINVRIGQNMSKIKSLIYLHCIDNGKILYYTDYSKSKEETCAIKKCG